MNVITVTQLNTYIKSLLDETPVLKTIYVKGEISNFKHYYKSGHMYLTLKDNNCQLKAVMFSSYASRLKFKPEDGMSVICRGRVSAYEKDGVYQLYIEDMQPDGIGSLSIALKRKACLTIHIKSRFLSILRKSVLQHQIWAQQLRISRILPKDVIR